MGTERHAFSSLTTPSFSKHRYKDNLLDPARGRHERPSPLADSSPSCSESEQAAESIKRHPGIPTIEVSDLGDDRGPAAPSKVKDENSASPRFGLSIRTPSPNRHPREGSSGSKLAALKKKTFHVLSLVHDKDGDKGKEHDDGLLKAPLTHLGGLSSGSLTWKRRAVSMPVPNLQKDGRMDILPHADPVATRSYLASGSPPIVDFTKFEDRYRSPSSDYDAMLSISKGNRNDKSISYFSLSRNEKNHTPGNVSSSGSSERGSQIGSFGKAQGGGITEMVRNSSGRNVLFPASERKSDLRLIMDALESASEMADIRTLLNVDDLLRIHDSDQQAFDFRERKAERIKKRGIGKPRTVFGESIQNVFMYASRSIVLGEREYILPIVVVHCVEEVYRTGIYQSNLFRTLPNRPRLHELISIFDSEEQPPGSIIRSRQSSSSSSPLEGFGAATSLHLESTPDICALLTSYLSALPEPILPSILFEAIWELCEVDKQPHTDFPEPRPPPPSSVLSAPVRLSSIPLARSYTTQSEAISILISQLFLHLLPSPHFFLFVYLLSFFSQVALVREENGVGIEDLSKMFGARIFGHGYGDVSSSKVIPAPHHSSSKSSRAKGKEKERNGRGEAMMVWFLRRWGPLSETLFEVVDDAKLGVLHRNKRMRKDSLGKAAMSSARIAAREALSAHEAVESEIVDELEDGERDDEVENLVERELLEDGDVSGNVDLPDPVNVVESPPTVHVPIAVDSQERAMASSVSFERNGSDLLALPQGDTMSSRSVTGAGAMTKDSAQFSSASSGSSSSTLPPYTARLSPNAHTILTAARCLYPDPLPSGRPDIRLSEAKLPGEEILVHSTPKKSKSGDGMPLNYKVGDADHSDEEPCATRPQEGGMPVGTIEQSFEDGESTHSLQSLHERLLDVSMPISIFDFDETLPASADVGDNQPSLLSSTPASAFSMTRKQGYEPRGSKVAGRTRNSSTSRIPSNTELKRQVSALPNRSSTFSLGSESRRSSAPSTVNAFLSPSPVPPMPVKSPKRTWDRSQARLPMSRSVGFQNRSCFPVMPTAAATGNEEKNKDEKDAVINALRDRLVEVEKERDEARKIVTEVRKALRKVEDGSLHTLLS